MIIMPDKILIVYYSLTGNTKMIAEAIKEAINADILALKPVKELNPKKASRFVWGGMQSTMKKKPELEPIDIDPLEYDLIFLGTPTWAWNFSPPIRSFINLYDLHSKKLAVWSCAGGKTEKPIINLKSIFGDNIIGELSLIEPKSKDTEKQTAKAVEWAKKIAQS